MKYLFLIIWLTLFAVSEVGPMTASAHYQPSNTCAPTPTLIPTLLPTPPCTPTASLSEVPTPSEVIVTDTPTPGPTATPAPTIEPTPTAGASANLTNSTVDVQSIPYSAPSTGRAE